MRGCYVEVDDGNRYLFVGGHHDGRVSMMHLEADGSIGGIADGIFHKGIGRSIAQRNFVPHVDCVKLTPDQKFLCAVDNGLDQVKSTAWIMRTVSWSSSTLSVDRSSLHRV